ncbi:Ger(x)C family spore germination protein [Bacillus cereus]
MKKHHQKKLITTMLFCTLCMTGCLPKTIIDDVQLIQGVVFDVEKEKIKETIACPIQKKGHAMNVFETIGNTYKQARNYSSLESAQPLVTGQLRVALFSKKLAKKGLTTAFDTLLRDSNIGHTIYVGILDGDGKDLFSGNYKGNFNTAIYIKNLFEHNMEEGSLPFNNLHISHYRYNEIGMDNFMPIIKKNKDKIKITGLALFKENKYITMLNSQEMFTFRTLFEKHKFSYREFKLHNHFVSIRNVNSTPYYRIDIKNGKPIIFIQIKIIADIQEISGNSNLQKKGERRKQVKLIEKNLNKEATSLILKLKKENIDPLGIGAKFKKEYRGFEIKEWRKTYAKVPIHIKYSINIYNSGVIE